MEGSMFFHRRGNSTDLDMQPSGIAGATIRPEKRQTPQTLSRKDSDRVKAAIKKIERKTGKK
jgi:hypothetical protein